MNSISRAGVTYNNNYSGGNLNPLIQQYWQLYNNTPQNMQSLLEQQIKRRKRRDPYGSTSLQNAIGNDALGWSNMIQQQRMPYLSMIANLTQAQNNNAMEWSYKNRLLDMQNDQQGLTNWQNRVNRGLAIKNALKGGYGGAYGGRRGGGASIMFMPSALSGNTRPGGNVRPGGGFHSVQGSSMYPGPQNNQSTNPFNAYRDAWHARRQMKQFLGMGQPDTSSFMPAAPSWTNAWSFE